MSDEDDVILPKPLPFVGQIFGRGKRVGGPPVQSDADHFYQCSQCGDWVDMRDLGDVFTHEGQHDKGPVQ